MRCVCSLSQLPHTSEALWFVFKETISQDTGFSLGYYLTGWERPVLFTAAHRGGSEVHSSLLRDYEAERGGIHGSHGNLTGWSP